MDQPIMTACARLPRFQRDTWTIPFTVSDGAGALIDLTGYTLAGEFYLSGQVGYSDINVGNGGIQPGGKGMFTAVVPALWTAKAPEDASTSPPVVAPAGPGGPPGALAPGRLASLWNSCVPRARVSPSTRLQVYWIDPYLNRQTLGVIVFAVYDGTECVTIDVTGGVQVTIGEAGVTLQVVASQGPAGPSSISAEQITDAGAVGVPLLKATTQASARAIIGAPGYADIKNPTNLPLLTTQFKDAIEDWQAGYLGQFFAAMVTGEEDSATRRAYFSTFAIPGGKFEALLSQWMQLSPSASMPGPGLGLTAQQALQQLINLRAAAQNESV